MMLVNGSAPVHCTSALQSSMCIEQTAARLCAYCNSERHSIHSFIYYSSFPIASCHLRDYEFLTDRMHKVCFEEGGEEVYHRG